MHFINEPVIKLLSLFQTQTRVSILGYLSVCVCVCVWVEGTKPGGGIGCENCWVKIQAV